MQGSWLIRQGFSLVGGASIEKFAHRIPEGPGVYVLLIANGNEILERAGYRAQSDRAPWKLGRFVHLYTGESFGVRSRVAHHVTGTIKDSNFRMTLLALQAACHAISPTTQSWVSEDWLTEWLRQNALVGFRRAEFIKEVEADILERSPSPLNIAGRSRSTFTKTLMGMRREYRRSSVLVVPNRTGAHPNGPAISKRYAPQTESRASFSDY